MSEIEIEWRLLSQEARRVLLNCIQNGMVVAAFNLDTQNSSFEDLRAVADFVEWMKDLDLN